MKKIFLSSIALLAPLFLSAQIDRDKMPISLQDIQLNIRTSWK